MTPDELTQWHRDQAAQTRTAQNQPHLAAHARANADDIHRAHAQHAISQQISYAAQVAQEAQRQNREAEAYAQRVNYYQTSRLQQQREQAFRSQVVQGGFRTLEQHAKNEHNAHRAEQGFFYRLTHRKW